MLTRRHLIKLLIGGLTVVALLRWHGALALDPTVHISQYAHKSWRIRDGFPSGFVESIAQTPDGYLWLGTAAGLVRFDGIRGVPVDPLGRRRSGGAIRAVLAAHDGSLWVGTPEGLARWSEGKITEYRELEGFDVYALREDHEGTIWVGASAKTSNICAIRGPTVRCDPVNSGVIDLYEDSERRLWAGIGAGLWLWEPGPRKFLPMSGATPYVSAIAETKPGEIILGTYNGVHPLRSGQIDSPTLANTDSWTVRRLMRDRDGSVWIGTNHGLRRLYQDRADVYTHSDGLTGDVILSLYEDREGNIWTGSTEGLDQFRAYSVASISRTEGLSRPPMAVSAARDGSVWIAGSDRLYRWKVGGLTSYNARSTEFGHEDGARPAVDHATSKTVRSASPESATHLVANDGRGRLWVSGDHTIWVLSRNRFSTQIDFGVGYVTLIEPDPDAGLWASHSSLGLAHLVGRKIVERIDWGTFESKEKATRLIADARRGGLWLGFRDGAIAYIDHDRVRASYDRRSGLPEGQVNDLFLDERGTLWTGTHGGISRLTKDRFQTLTTDGGLPCAIVHWLIQDRSHAFWLGTACGVLRIDEGELDKWAAGANEHVHPRVFDSADGVISQAIVSDGRPLVTMTPDGKIWFLVTDGISVIDPQNIHTNPLPPPVHIEHITADRKSYSIQYGLSLPPVVRDLQIDYTALSLVAPEKVMFRYKLEDHDRDWRDAGTRRQAFYTDLPPGKYRFRVIASNNSGVWNRQGASLDFSIAPAYWQTNWFRALCVAAVLALMALLYWLRIRQVAHRFDLLVDARVGERMRIARELHDTLLQSFNAALFRFGAAQKLLSTRPDEAREMLDGAMDEARAAITEGRQSVQGLRSSVIETNDLSESIRNLAQTLASESPRGAATEVRLKVIGTPRVLRPLVRDEIYRIAGEALRNAFRHAEANRIEVQLEYDARRFELRVRDDGRGIDSRFLGDKGLPGHFGLPGMRERAQQLGGKLTVWSAPESGTEIALTVPGARAYGRTQRT